MAGVRKWLADNKDAKTLIFDLRNHHGGGLDEQDAIFSYLFAKKTPLVKMALAKSTFIDSAVRRFSRGRPCNSPATATKWSPRTGDPRRGHAAAQGQGLSAGVEPVRISRRAFRAGGQVERPRRRLIGEATAGANHFGGPVPLNDHFAVWMPVGRTYDIKTGKDWEGDRVAPDIAVDPKQALVFALEKAGLSHEEAVRLDAAEVPAEPVHRDKLRAR